MYKLIILSLTLTACGLQAGPDQGHGPTSTEENAAAAEVDAGHTVADAGHTEPSVDAGTIDAADASETAACEMRYLNTYLGSCVGMQDTVCTDYYGAIDDMKACLTKPGARYQTEHCSTDNSSGVCFVDRRGDMSLSAPKRCVELTIVTYPLNGAPSDDSRASSKALCDSLGGVWQ